MHLRLIAWQVTHVDMNVSARPCGIESCRFPKTHTKLEHTCSTSFSTKAVFLLCNDHDRSNTHFDEVSDIGSNKVWAIALYLKEHQKTVYLRNPGAVGENSIANSGKSPNLYSPAEDM